MNNIKKMLSAFVFVGVAFGNVMPMQESSTYTSIEQIKHKHPNLYPHLGLDKILPAPDGENLMLLKRAARSGDADAVRFILDRNRHLVNAVCHYHWTLLHHAAFTGQLNVVKVLLNYPEIKISPVNVPASLSCTPLDYAIHFGFTEIEKLLRAREACRGPRTWEEKWAYYYQHQQSK